MRSRAGILVIWLLALAVCVGVIARTRFNTDMQAFLPSAPAPAQQILVDQLREGVVSRLVLVAVEGVPEAISAILSLEMAQALRRDDRFALIANGDQQALGREQAIVWRNRYLLSPAVADGHFSTDSLRVALETDLRLLGSDLGLIIKRALPADPTGEALGLVQSLAGQSHAATREGVWMTQDGASALLMVSTRAAGFDIDAQLAALTAIRAAFDAARAKHAEAASARLVLTGPPVFAVQSRDRIKGDAERFSVIATLLVAAILLAAYRSPRVLALALLPVASGALAGVAAVGVAFGFVHGITLGFGVTLIGEAVDYAIYLFTQTRSGENARATLPRIWRILRLGMLTSVCGFSAMLFSDFTGFAQLGLFTIVGLVTALAVTRFVLPELLPDGFSAIGATGFARPVLALMRTGRRMRWAVLGLSILAGTVLVLHAGPYWEDALASMSPIPAADLAVDARLRSEIGAPDVRNLLVIEGRDREAVLQASEAMAAALAPVVASGGITGFETPSRFLPSQAAQAMRRDAIPAKAVLAANLAEAVAATPFRFESFAPFLVDAEAARTGPLLERGDLDGTSLALQVDTLLLSRKSGWAALLPLQGVADPGALARQIAGLGRPDVVFVDLRRESDGLLSSYRAEAVKLSLAGSAVIVLLLAVSLRRPRRIVAVLLPLVAAVLCTAALLLGFGHRLSIFNLFGLLLVVAVGSNYALFFEETDPAAAPAGRVVASLMLANLCTVIGFGILGFSDIPVLGGIGGTVAIGALLSLVFAAVLSPQPQRRPA